MRAVFATAFLLCGVLADFPSHRSGRNLLQVQVTHRHGDRVPTGWGIPNDYFNWATTKHGGLGLTSGQLTGVGMGQAYKLGQFLKARYMSGDTPLISNNYFVSPFLKDAFVRSTDVDRTLMTATSVLRAMYENSVSSENDITHEQALPGGMQPVPIHTEIGFDYLLQAGIDYCPVFHELKEDLYESSAWKAKEAEYKSFIKEFQQVTGFDGTHEPEYRKAELKSFYDVYDPVYCQWSHGKLNNIKDWVEANLAKIQEIADYSVWQKSKVGNKLTAGVLAGEIANQQKMTVCAQFCNFWDDGTPIYPCNDIPTECLPEYSPWYIGPQSAKFLEYSAHDSTLMALATTLGWDELTPEMQKIPPYASAFLVELWADNSNPGVANYTVEVIFRNGLTEAVTPIATYNMSEWSALIDERGFRDTNPWCLACNNTKTMEEELPWKRQTAGACLRYLPGYNTSGITKMPTPRTPPPSHLTAEPTNGPTTPRPTKQGDTMGPTQRPTVHVPTMAPACPPTASADAELTETRAKLEASEGTVTSQRGAIIFLSITTLLSLALAAWLWTSRRTLMRMAVINGSVPYSGLSDDGAP